MLEINVFYTFSIETSTIVPHKLTFSVHWEQHFKGNLHVRSYLESKSQKDEEICSPLSFHVRPHQGVCNTPVQLPAKYKI